MIENPFKVKHHPDPLLGAWQVVDTRTEDVRLSTTSFFQAQIRAEILWRAECADLPHP